MRVLVALVLSTFAVVSCKGDAGPMGPAGPAGPGGPGTKLLLTATVDGTGRANAVLPASAGTDPAKPPAMTCYVASSASAGAWVAVASAPSSTYPYCGLVFTGGTFTASMLQAPTGYTAAFVIVY
jgi:hypothetical protein